MGRIFQPTSQVASTTTKFIQSRSHRIGVMQIIRMSLVPYCRYKRYMAEPNGYTKGGPFAGRVGESWFPIIIAAYGP